MAQAVDNLPKHEVLNSNSSTWTTKNININNIIKREKFVGKEEAVWGTIEVLKKACNIVSTHFLNYS
jgi:hypothetical protein